MKSILLDPGGDVDSKVNAIPTKEGIKNLRSKLTFFDRFETIKEKFPPAAFRVGLDFRRLTDFGDPIAQSYLSQKGLIFAHNIRGETTLETAVSNMIDTLSKEVPLIDLILPERITKQLSQTQPCIVVKAIDGLTVPPETASLEDILLFKEHRRAEYEAFWHCVDEITNEIEWLGAPNSLMSLKGNLLAALADFERVNSEKWGRRVVDSLSLTFTVAQSSIIAIGASELAKAIGRADFASVIAGLAGPVTFSFLMCQSTPPLSDRSRAMSYASRVRTLK